ncbi:hypothetical protein [Mesorhizobium sp. M0977]|uniref:hypothetical protein n=1 Tax=Mesorhizobium sp. M0977 TaxID=2957039 RepID=UPI00333AA577
MAGGNVVKVAHSIKSASLLGASQSESIGGGPHGGCFILKTEMRLSPMTRLYAAFDLELKIDKLGILKNLRGRYVERLNVAEGKRDSILRALFLLDAIIVVLISGKSLNIPLLNITTADLPGILEIATATSAIAAIFFAIAFINWAAYEAIVSQFAIREAEPSFVDPDFIQAAEKHTELTLKLLRTKFNIWGVDFHEPGQEFVLYSRIMNGLFTALFILFPILHYILTGMSFIETFNRNEIGLVYIIYFGIVILANVLAVLLLIGIYHDFRFLVEIPTDAPTAQPE